MADDLGTVPTSIPGFPDPAEGDAALVETLTRSLGRDRVSADPELRALYSQDIWAAGPATAELVASPSSTPELAQAVRAAAEAGYALAVRGGGMSYTSGYVPDRARTVVLDLARMDRVLQVSPEDMTVTVEAGCTWKALNERLGPMGLRTPFWGPLSGYSSTVGGGLSQLNAFFGAGHYGTSSESVVALAVILPSGEVLRTGARGPDGTKPFYRHFGPDLTGLFCGDCGVFGVKAEITLRLIRAPSHERYASFSFKTRSSCVEALAELTRAGVAAEACAFDPNLARARLRRASLMADVKTLGSVAAKQGSLLGGLKEAAKIALAGRGFVGEADWSVHLVFESRSAAGADADLEIAREIAIAAGGAEIENTIPKVLRAQPFTPLNNVLGPSGERWAPVHGIVALSDADAAYAALEALFAGLAPEFQREGIETGFMLTTMSTNAFLIEPVFYWPEARLPIHERTLEPGFLARLPRHAANPGATAVVAEARRKVVEVFARYGAAHFQIGRTYPYRESRDEPSRRLLDAIKATLDPDRALNPGVLGFPA